MKWGIWHTPKTGHPKSKTTRTGWFWKSDETPLIFDTYDRAVKEQANLEKSFGTISTYEVRVYELKSKDTVVSPLHYVAFPGIEVIQLTRNLNFNRGNAVKYLARAGKKTKDGEPGPTVQGDLEDIKKALWYVADECQRLGVSAEEIARIVAPHAGHK